MTDTAFDRGTLQIVANHFRAAAESMAYTLYRTAHSAFVRETEDFTIGIVTPAGRTFCVPMDYGATWYPGLDYGPAMAMIDGYEDGDICFTNDPYSGFLCTHTPDIHMWKPVFHEGEIVCFTVGHIHNTDMGGAVPASLSRANTEVHQEGIRFPPSRLWRAGVLNEDLLRTMLINVRKPDMNWGDLEAFAGALSVGERKIRDMIARLGIATVRRAMDAVMDHSERQTRALLAGMPDGTWHFTDFCDEDSVGGRPVRLNLALTIAGDEATLDFTGSDPQLTSSLNVPTGGNPRHTLMLVGIYYVLYSLNPDILVNAGMTRPFTCVLPEGSVVNPVFPAAVGMRSLTCGRLRSLIFGAFAQAIPERMPAAPAGSSSIVNVMTTDPATGTRYIAAIDPVVGGAGGMPHRDGTDGSGADGAYLKNTPVEINEAEVPVEILRYALAPDSGGAGRWRGGLGTVLEFRVFSPDTRITIRNRDRSHFAAWGTLGGRAGETSGSVLNPGTAREVALGNQDYVIAGPGDVFRIWSPGGGGRGRPEEREPERVLKDVERGFLSAQRAGRDYGVVLAGGAVDAAATRAERARRLAAAPPPAMFDFGPGRRAFEAVWTPAAYEALMAILFRLPVDWRFFVKHAVFAAVEALPAGQRGSAAAIEAIFADLRRTYPQIRTVPAAAQLS